MSETSKATWRSVDAWAEVVTQGRSGIARGDPGVVAQPIANCGLASIIAAHKGSTDLTSVFNQFAIKAPDSPQVTRGRGFDLIWTGHAQWLAISPNRDLAKRLVESIGESVAVADQTGARAVLRLSGPNIRAALAKGCPIDLDSRVFREGGAAATTISLVGVIVWRLPNDDAIHLSMFRSMVSSFWSWLVESSAEFGFEGHIPVSLLSR